MDHPHGNFNITCYDNDSLTNTPTTARSCNIENERKKEYSDWNDASIVSQLQTNTSTEPTIIDLQVETQTTDTNDSIPESLFNREHETVRSAQQESCGNQTTITTARIELIIESPQPKTEIQKLLEQEIEYEDPFAQQPDDTDASIIIDKSTMATENIRGSEDFSSISQLFVSASSSFPNERTHRYLPETRMLSTSVIPTTGFFRHPIASKYRMRYERELANNRMSLIMTCIKDCFYQHPLYIGPCTLFLNRYIEISVLSTTPDNYLIFSPHSLYRSNVPDDEKFSNPICLRCDQLEIEQGCVKLDLKVAKKLQDDFPQQASSNGGHRWKKTSASVIKYYPSGEKVLVRMTPRQLHKSYQLDSMFIAVRPVQLESDGISYRAQPDSIVILSNRFLGVDSGDSPATWNFNDHKLSISEMKITNRNVSADENENCKLEFILTIPELYRCTLNSGTKQLEMTLVTDESLSEMYKIVSEETTQNPFHLPVHEVEINVQLPISKENCSRQNRPWLVLSSTQADYTGRNHFHVEICLQDVDMTDRRTYPHSSVQSTELYDIALSTDTQQFFCAKQRDDAMESVASGKRRIDQIDTLNQSLPVTKMPKTTDT